MIKSRLRLLVSSVLVVCVVGLLAIWGVIYYVWRPAIPEHKLAQIHDGMTKLEVSRILGEPRKIRKSADARETWFYYRPMQWATFSIEFSTEGEVTSFEHDR